MRQLDEDAGTHRRGRIGAACPAVLEVFEHRDAYPRSRGARGGHQCRRRDRRRTRRVRKPGRRGRSRAEVLQACASLVPGALSQHASQSTNRKITSLRCESRMGGCMRVPDAGHANNAGSNHAPAVYSGRHETRPRALRVRQSHRDPYQALRHATPDPAAWMKAQIDDLLGSRRACARPSRKGGRAPRSRLVCTSGS